jgi:ABC-type uncharacterized transport system substrate-binding protein
MNDPHAHFVRLPPKSAREPARQLKLEILERHVMSVEELQRGVLALKAQEADAFFYINDAMVTSQAQFIIDTARAKKLPTMFSQPEFVALGALAGYGVTFQEVGRLSAKYVQRVLTDQPSEPAGRIAQQGRVGRQPQNGTRDWRHDPARRCCCARIRLFNERSVGRDRCHRSQAFGPAPTPIAL